jgi:hypothetical protein
MILLLLEQSDVANAAIIHSSFPNSDVDTSKPMAPQFNSIFQYQKTHLSAEQYRNITEGLGRTMENTTNACSSPFASFLPQAQKV